KVSELPLKNFYRLVLGPTSQSRASFEGLPKRDILTQRLDTPEPWNVQASAALQDIDNLRCDAAGCGDHGTLTTSAEYTLKGLLLSGRCYDATPANASPPQGLQLVLKEPSQWTTAAAAAPAGSGDTAAADVGSGGGGGGGGGGTPITDTVVMNNLGYFQLQASPGVWELALADGRASDVYEIIARADEGGGSGGGGGSGSSSTTTVHAARDLERRLRVMKGEKEAGAPPPAAAESQLIVMRNFYSRYEPVLVRKRAGMEDVGLLDSESPPPPSTRRKSDSAAAAAAAAAAASYKASSKIDGGGGGVVVAAGGEGEGRALARRKGEDGGEEGDRVHVFSLATGHLYERFLKVMMMSVVKRSSVPVTFWLLENFLSSSLKESAQLLAEEFGFRVEFVTYKWPEWLRRQSEKQRIIWGYKILFLDVLFPLHVDKIIYVDADQVRRVRELEIFMRQIER
ncbi:unnamed protein product, partial [Laminaria digitata]